MHIEIAECRDTARMHADYISQTPTTKEGTNIDGTPDLVFWTDASANPQQQSGPGGAALVFQTVDKHGHAVWQHVTFGVSGQRNIHDVELHAVLFALWVARDMCTARKQAEPTVSQDDMETTDHTAREERESNLSQDSLGYPRMKKVRIMSDSQKALQRISTKKMPALTKLVYALVRKIEDCGFLVEVRWVPGHSVPGNKLADKLAADAAKRLRARKGSVCPSKEGIYLIWPERNRRLVEKSHIGVCSTEQQEPKPGQARSQARETEVYLARQIDLRT